MATYYVNSGAGGANDGSSWADAYTAFASAVTAATTDDDEILVHKAHQENLSGDTTYSFGAHISVYSVDKDSSDALTAMGTGGWIGHSSNSLTVTLAGDFHVYIYGLTLRNAGNSNDSLRIGGNNADGNHYELEDCYLWLGTAHASPAITFGSNNRNNYAKAIDCTLRFGNTGQQLLCKGSVEFIGGSVSSDGSAPTAFIESASGVNGTVRIDGMDLSHLGSGTIVGNHNRMPLTVILVNCKLGASFVLFTASPSPANKSNAVVWAFDCHSGDSNVQIAYSDAFGTVTVSTSIYATAGAAQASWVVTTTANASFRAPFTTPWIDFYNDTLSAQTFSLEILRDGSATAYQDDEVWGEFLIKDVTGFPQTSLHHDRMTPRGTAANQATGSLGASDWTGEGGTAWFGKVESGSVTPAEAGHVRARVVVGEPSITVYVDPQVRTA